MPARNALGIDPLASPPRIPPVIPTAQPDSPQATPASTTRAAAKSTPTKPPVLPAERRKGSVARLGPISHQMGARKKQVTFYGDPDLLEEARDAIIAFGADPEGPRTLSHLIEEGIRREIIRLQDELNGGQPIPQRRVNLKRGGNTRE